MKKLLKVLAAILGFVFVVIAMYFFLIFWTMSNHYKEFNKVMSVQIYFEEELDNLKEIKFTACDSIYTFSLPELRDTIYDDLRISNKHFPCEVSVKYFFKNATYKNLSVEKFDCGGCLGTNIYILKKDSVEYIYHP